MRYISTRGQAPVRDFAGVLLAGLAEDGGLYVPETWPHFGPADWRAMRSLSYPELVARVMQPFVADSIPAATMLRLSREAYANFGHPAVAPMVRRPMVAPIGQHRGRAANQATQGKRQGEETNRG